MLRRDYQRILLLISVLSLPACAQQPAAETKAEQQSQPVAVKAVSVQAENLSRTSTQPATVHAFYAAQLNARVTGYVKEVKADIGDYVEKDTVLAVLDVPELDRQKESLEAQVKRHESLEEQALAGVEVAKADVLSAKARLEQSKSERDQVAASLAAAEAEFQRTQDLVQRQSLERRVLDEVTKKRDSERAAAKAVESAIRSAEADVTVAEAKLNAAGADLKVAQANTTIAEKQRDELDVMIGYASLKAPFAGVVTQRSIDLGDLVRSGDSEAGNALYVVCKVDKVRVQMPVPEADAALVNRGDKVTLTLPFYSSEKPITGSVTRTSQSLDRSTRTMLVEAEMENPEGKLLPGMFGEATIELSTQVASHTLPARAVRFSETGNAYVYALDKDDTVTVTEVTTGIDTGAIIEIRSGITSGQRVIDAHRDRFTNGQKVSVLK